MNYHNHTADRSHRHWHWHFTNTYYRFTVWRDALFQHRGVFSGGMVVVMTFLVLIILSKTIPAGGQELSHNAPGWNTTLQLK